MLKNKKVFIGKYALDKKNFNNSVLISKAFRNQLLYFLTHLALIGTSFGVLTFYLVKNWDKISLQLYEKILLTVGFVFLTGLVWCIFCLPHLLNMSNLYNNVQVDSNNIFERFSVLQDIKDIFELFLDTQEKRDAFLTYYNARSIIKYQSYDILFNLDISDFSQIIDLYKSYINNIYKKNDNISNQLVPVNKSPLFNELQEAQLSRIVNFNQLKFEINVLKNKDILKRALGAFLKEDSMNFDGKKYKDFNNFSIKLSKIIKKYPLKYLNNILYLELKLLKKEKKIYGDYKLFFNNEQVKEVFNNNSLFYLHFFLKNNFNKNINQEEKEMFYKVINQINGKEINDELWNMDIRTIRYIFENFFSSTIFIEKKMIM